MTKPPDAVVALAQERGRARAERDFARADSLRDEIAGLGYVVTDTPDGFALAPRPPFAVAASAAALAVEVPEARCTVGVVIDGWPDDVRACIDALVRHAPPDAVVLGVDCGDVDGAGLVLHELAAAHPGRVVEAHLAGTLATVGWAAAVTAVLDVARSPLVAVCDLSTVLEGDALTPILAEFDDPTVVASGWRGVNVDLADGWRSFVDAGPGEVDAVLGYLLVVRREAALAAGPHPKARFYRNADMEWCLALREAGGRLVVPAGPLPLRQDRHHGYHDSDPEYRDRESRRTYDRLLARFRSQPGILSPRAAGPGA